MIGGPVSQAHLLGQVVRISAGLPAVVSCQRFTLLPAPSHLGLLDPPVFLIEGNPQGVGDAVEIIHHADQRHRVHDILVGESLCSELLEILL